MVARPGVSEKHHCPTESGQAESTNSPRTGFRLFVAVVSWTPCAFVAVSGGRMRNRFDHLAKEIGQKALGPCGPTVVHDGISPETQFADLRHEPNPARKAERARLGLLGRISATLCLIEVYGHAPSAEEFRACLAKHLAFWQQRARNKRRTQKRQARKKFVEPSAPF